MKQYINKIRQKSEVERNQYALLWTIVSMALVGSVWVFSMSHRFNSKVSTQVNEDIKPFSILGKTLSNTYNNISASVGNITSVKNKIETNQATQTPDKVIDLIPIEQTTETQ